MVCEIELEIRADAGPNRFAVRVVRAASGGEPSAVMQLDVDRLLAGRDALETAVLLSTVAGRKLVPVEEEQLRTVGRHLFEALFQGAINSVYRASMMVAQQNNERLRVVLRLNAPGLAALPWEALWDPEVESYTCMREPLVRHVPAPYSLEPLDVVAPLRILGLTASPRGLPELDVEAEEEFLSKALARPIEEGLIELHWLHQARWDGVHDMLISGRWHVVHFIGHGDYDVDTEQGVIALVGHDGRKDLVDAERLAALLGEAEPTPRLVVLNSCSSGEEGTQDLFSGTAAALVRSGISAVAAMQFTISDAAALRFAHGFYTALARGRDIAAAVRAGRIEILGTPRSLEWVTPVLYLRGDNARLFDLRSPAAPSSRPRTPSPPPPTLDRREVQPARAGGPPEAHLHAMYLAAKFEQRAKNYKRAVALFDELLSLDATYSDAAALRSETGRQLKLEEKYQNALEAQLSGDWLKAARVYSEIIDAEPAYRDVADRAQVCRTAQQVTDLRHELRYHSDAGNWQAVLDANAELEALDPLAANPDGIATHAVETMEFINRQAELEARYERARAAEESNDLNGANQEFDAILEIDPGYRDAAMRQEVLEAFLALKKEDASRADQSHTPDVPGVSEDDTDATTPEDTAKGSEHHSDEQSVPLRMINYLTSNVLAVSWSRDGTKIAIGANSSKMKIYDPDFNVTSSVRVGYWGTATTSCAFSPDGTRIVAGTSMGSARIWDLDTGKECQKLEHPAGVRAVVFSPDGERLATACGDSLARVWNATSGELLLKIEHVQAVLCLAFSPDGSELGTGSDDHCARIWDSSTGLLRTLVGGPRGDTFTDRPVCSVAFSPDGSAIATADSSAKARVWDARSGREKYSVRHANAINAVAFSPNGQWLGSCGAGGLVRVWTTASGTKHTGIQHSVSQDLLTLGFHPDRNLLATGGNTCVALWPFDL